MLSELRLLRQSGASVRMSKRQGVRLIEGYAARYYNGSPATEYILWENTVERIRAGAFDRAIAEHHDVRALFNHNADNLLGRTANGTCLLSVDSRGLRYEIEIDENDPDHQRVIAKIERGDLTGSSFAFQATRITWEEIEGGPTVRWIEDVQLYDVGPVTFPAYSASSTGLRSDEQLAALKEEHRRWKTIDGDWRRRWLKLVKLKVEDDEKRVKREALINWREKWVADRMEGDAMKIWRRRKSLCYSF